MSDRCPKCGQPYEAHVPVLEQTSGPPYKTEYQVARGSGLCPVPASPALDHDAVYRDAYCNQGKDLDLSKTHPALARAYDRQHVALRDAAVQKAREEEREKLIVREQEAVEAVERIALERDEMARLAGRQANVMGTYAPLVAAVREWQKARKAIEEYKGARPESVYQRMREASTALAQIPLPT